LWEGKTLLYHHPKPTYLRAKFHVLVPIHFLNG
jgi:hypothetical protein